MCVRGEEVKGVAVGFLMVALEQHDRGGGRDTLPDANHRMDLLLDGMCQEHVGQVVAYMSGLTSVVLRRHLGEYAESYLQDIALGAD